MQGKNEKYIITTVDAPFNGVKKALVIAGSDRRGTIYGVYELSKQLGVSPWYWWMDVPEVKRTEAYILPGIYTDGEPAVKYRGIYLNDEMIANPRVMCAITEGSCLIEVDTYEQAQVLSEALEKCK